VTDDRFVLVVAEEDAAFNPVEARRLFRSYGALSVEEQAVQDLPGKETR
jgi:hypothetical protein